jgi:hypothetical protein
MSSKPPHSPPGPAKCDEMLTPEEFAKVLKVRFSWLAKARKRGDGPPAVVSLAARRHQAATPRRRR